MLVSRILFLNNYLSLDICYQIPQAALPTALSRASKDTALHAGKHLAVSFEFNQLVSVRRSWLTPDGRYPLPFSKISFGRVRTFLTAYFYVVQLFDMY